MSRRDRQITLPGKRVVLDTNYFYSLKAEELADLRARGWQVSVWMGALTEALVKAAEEDNPGRIFTNARKVAPYLDSGCPVTPYMGEAARMMGASSYRERRWMHRHLTHLAWHWRAILAGQVDFRRSGAFVAGHYERDDWSARLAHPKIHGVARGMPFEMAFRASLAFFRPSNRRLRLRCHGLWHVQSYRVAMHATQPEQQPRPEQNDNEDLKILGQVGLPAVVLTQEKRLRRDLRASGSVHAPFVRTLEEMTELPWSRSPWGPGSRAGLRLFLDAARERYGPNLA